jgi:hypothetical protein
MPRPFYIDVIETLNRAGVRYTVVGGVATILHGTPRMTGDLDLAVVLDKENILSLVNALKSLGYKTRVPVNPEDLANPEVRELWKKEKGMRVFTFFYPEKPFAEVDILVEQPFDFRGIWERRVDYHAGNVVVPTASIDDLIAMKGISGRDKDLADIAALNRVKILKGKEGR